MLDAIFILLHKSDYNNNEIEWGNKKPSILYQGKKYK